MEVRFRLLGTFEARAGDEVIDPGHARQQAVLIALLMEANEFVQVDQLVERVWADRAPLRARNTLYGYVYRLRHALRAAPGVGITHRSGGYRITVDPETVDVHRFTRLAAQARTTANEHSRSSVLAEALALWRGIPFAGLDTPWLNTLRDTLTSQRFAAELEYTDIALRAGRHQELLAGLASRIEEHPLDERLAAQFMLALYRSGQAAEALSHYDRLRRRLADELGASPGTTLQELHQRILSADHSLTGRFTANDAARELTPQQLPASSQLFAGRAAELARLDEALAGLDTGATVVISAIGGGGGVGKTWLALHWAHANINLFIDGQLYVNLRGFDPAGSPLHPGEAVRGFLCALGVAPSAIPVDMDTRTALYRSLIADRKMLVMLDNARDSAQVVPLLPGSATSAVIVTSRDKLAGLVVAHGARPLALDVLEPDEAMALLARRITAPRLAAEPEAVAELLAYCSGLPLALGIVGSRAAMEPQIPLEVLAADLRQAATRLGALDFGDPDISVRAVLSVSYLALPPRQAEVFRLLGLIPGPDIGLPAVSALTGLPLAEVAAVLQALEQVSLVGQHLPGRYRMHDLIRLYAGEQAQSDQPADSRETAIRRLSDFYLHTAHAADRLLDPHSPPVELEPPIDGRPAHPLADEAAALAWLDTEHHCLLAIQKRAVEHRWHAAVWQMAWGLTTFHLRRGHLHDDIDAWKAGLVAAQRLGDHSTEALAHRMLGDTYARMGDHASALDHLNPALSLAEQIDDPSGQAHAHIALAGAWAAVGDCAKALDHATQALPLYRALQNSVWEARTLNQMGRVMAKLGDPEQAMTHCEAALELGERHHDRHGTAAALASLGLLNHLAGRHEAALDHDENAAKLYRDLGDVYEEADTVEHIGQVRTALGDHARAREAWRHALNLYRAQHRAAEAERVQRQLAASSDDH